jgi:polyprenyl-phospho-N-acetylgalactosaminyl synthase
VFRGDTRLRKRESGVTVDQTNAWRGCIVIPTYDNPRTIQSVVEGSKAFGLPIIVVDDGSGSAGRQACEDLSRLGLAHVIHHGINQGKGAALKTAFDAARKLGFTHAIQVDGDGQHDLTCITPFMQSSREHPEAFLLAYPVYDQSVPKVRLVARKLTNFWVNFEVGCGKVRDAMIGFRVYPLAALEGVTVKANRMDFDIEVTVKLAWAKTPILNLPVPVRYLTEAEGGVSHFQHFWDNFRFSRLHCKLCTLRCMAWLLPKRVLLRW